MPTTLLLAGALIPGEVATALVPMLELPALRALLKRATVVGSAEHAGRADIDWLANNVFHRSQGLSTAPYAYAALTGRPPAARGVWHAEPFHLELARDHLVPMPLTSPPTAGEADALIDSANAVFEGSAVRLERVDDHWFLHESGGWGLNAAPFEAVVGAPLHEMLPTGPDAAAWLRLLNEIQMVWHADAINEAREASGERTVNSLWLYGGGAWCELEPLSYPVVNSDAVEVRGAAMAAGSLTTANDEPLRDGGLAVWTGARMPRAQHDWPAWKIAMQKVDARVASISTGPVDIVLTGERRSRRLLAQPSDRLKLWKSRPLEETLSE